MKTKRVISCEDAIVYTLKGMDWTVRKVGELRVWITTDGLLSEVLVERVACHVRKVVEHELRHTH